MSFLGDKKREHELQAEVCFEEDDFARTAFHYFMAADLGLMLAGQCHGRIRRRYVDDAEQLLELAEKLKTRASKLGSAPDRNPLANVMKEAEDASDGNPPTYQLTEKPEVRLDDVAGLEDVKEILRTQVILPFQHPEEYADLRVDPGAGVLMYGPPGNGKTFIARSIAGELDAAFFPVDLSQMKSKYVGETARNLSRLFQEAKRHSRSVIFLDECDALLGKRGNRKVDSVAQFLALTDGLVKYKNCILLLAATNRPWLLDEAVIREGRLGTHIYVGLPDLGAREAILRYNFKGTPAAHDIDWAELAAATEAYSGAELAALAKAAKLRTFKRRLAGASKSPVTPDDLHAALVSVKPSTSRALLRDFEKWRTTRAVPAGADLDDD